MFRVPTFNEKQLDIAEKVLINSANVILATLILGNIINPKGFNLQLFIWGCMIFVGAILSALSMRKGKRTLSS